MLCILALDLNTWYLTIRWASMLGGSACNARRRASADGVLQRSVLSIAVRHEHVGPAGVACLLSEAQAEAAGAGGHLSAEEVDLAAAASCGSHTSRSSADMMYVSIQRCRASSSRAVRKASKQGKAAQVMCAAPARLAYADTHSDYVHHGEAEVGDNSATSRQPR